MSIYGQRRRTFPVYAGCEITLPLINNLVSVNSSVSMFKNASGTMQSN